VDVGEDGKQVTSCVVERVVDHERPPPQQQAEGDPASREEPDQPNAEYTIRWKLREFGPGGVTGSELLEATGLKDATFYRHLGYMRASGEVETIPGPRPFRYRLKGSGGDSHSHSQPPLGSDESEIGHSQSQSRAPVGGETGTEAETGPERDLYGDRDEEGYHGD